MTVLDVEPWARIAPLAGLEVHVFRVRRWRGDPHNATPVEHDDLAWLTPAEVGVLRLAHPAVRDWIADATRPRR